MAQHGASSGRRLWEDREGAELLKGKRRKKKPNKKPHGTIFVS